MTKTSGIKSLAFGFCFLFMAFHAVERHVSAFFAASGSLFEGLLTLSVGYFFLLVGDVYSPVVLSKWGTRKSLMVGGSAYFFWILCVASEVQWLLLPVTVVAGFAAALMWNGMVTHVVRLGEMTKTQELTSYRIGVVLAWYGIGAFAGLVGISFLAPALGLRWTFVVLSAAVPVGVFFFYKTPTIREIPPVEGLDVRKALTNGTVVSLATISGTAFLIFGLLVTVVPLQIQAALGFKSIGLLSSIAFLTLAPCAFFGSLVERFGKNRLIFIAYAGLGCGLLALIFCSGPWAIVPGVTALCLSFGILFPMMFTLAECAPLHKLESVQAVMTSGDDIAIFLMLVLSMVLESRGLPLDYLYWFTLGCGGISFALILPLLKGEGRNLEEASRRLALAFPEPEEATKTEADVVLRSDPGSSSEVRVA